MKCIAIDDEPVALALITQFCKRMDGVEVTTFSDPVAGMKRVAECCPDVVLLDIEMNGISGIDLARALPKGTLLIFTTAYAQFALDGFELNAVDFLHKPFSFARFEKAICKARELMDMQKLKCAADASGDEIVVKVEYKNVRVALDSVQYIEAMDNYVRIHLAKGRPVVSQMNLKALMAMLPADDFVRVHKSFVVAVKKIASFTRQKITLYYKSVEIPVGRVYADEFMERMNSR